MRQTGETGEGKGVVERTKNIRMEKKRNQLGEGEVVAERNTPWG